jgi:signal transduction histidine kinase
MMNATLPAPSSSTAVAGRLLVGALRERDAARVARAATARALHLASISRDLAMTLDEAETREVVRRLTLPAPGSWCIVEVVESNGEVHRLGAIHPNAVKRDLALTLEYTGPMTSEVVDPRPLAPRGRMVSRDSHDELVKLLHDELSLMILETLGFGSLLVVPLVVRSRAQGVMIFVNPIDNETFSSDDRALAVEIGAHCALALDNARLFREAGLLRQEAEAANAAKSTFLAAMSHELRTPLNAIIGFTELMTLGLQGPTSYEQQLALERITINARHLLTLISEVLEFARLGGGRVTISCTDLPMTRAIAEVKDMLVAVAAEKGLSFKLGVMEEDTIAYADPDRVRQILLNIIMNAVKYAPADNGPIELSVFVEDDMVIAEVADQGPGIASESFGAIFEPFIQLESGLKERRGGVGLGLAISRGLARAMDGDLTVSSTPGNGACFRLSLRAGRARRSTRLLS